MEDGSRKCAWCKKEFFPTDKRQKYCSVKCREQAKNFFRSREYKRPLAKGQAACNRKDCKLYRDKLANHCDALTEVPKDIMVCGFYKEKK